MSLLLCPAKINLGLAVPYRRPDGYHEIESLFLPVDFCDELTISKADALRLRTENLIELSTRSDFESVSERGNPEKNLLMRIMRAINAERTEPLHLEIFLRKRIPSGAGLGGGSSNAGALLRWLVDEGWIDADRAFTLARSHGADIPFFLDPRPAAVTGYGETIEPLATPEKATVPFRGVLVLSNVVVPTKIAYSELKRPLQSASSSKAGISPGEAYRAFLAGDAKTLSSVVNDFEEVVFRLHPELMSVKQALLECGALYASMTGSGSAIYGLFHTGQEEERLAILRQRFPEHRVVPFGFLF